MYQRHPASTPVLSGYADASFASEDESLSQVLDTFIYSKATLVSWTSEIFLVWSHLQPRQSVGDSFSSQKKIFGTENFILSSKLFSLSTPTIVYEDNTSSISLSKNLGVPHKRSKHFDIEFNFFKQSVDWKEVAPLYVSTEEQAADMLTKTLPTQQFVYLREKVMGSQQVQDYFTV